MKTKKSIWDALTPAWQRRLIVILASCLFIETAIFVYFLTGLKKKAVFIPPEIKPEYKIAIVIDDWANSLNNLPIVEEIKFPLTASVLPGLDLSRKVAERLHSLGLEVILHLPMEPKEKYRLEKNTILVTMDEKTIKDIFNADLDSIPYLKGVSNHMGSKATVDPKTVGVLLNEIKKRNLYFLDSLVTGRSVCKGVARKVGVRFARRDVFLDNLEEPEYIKRQLNELKAIAKTRGFGIGIGHDRKVTLEVLRKSIPELSRQGYKFVFVSELVK